MKKIITKGSAFDWGVQQGLECKTLFEIMLESKAFNESIDKDLI